MLNINANEKLMSKIEALPKKNITKSEKIHSRKEILDCLHFWDGTNGNPCSYTFMHINKYERDKVKVSGTIHTLVNGFHLVKANITPGFKEYDVNKGTLLVKPNGVIALELFQSEKEKGNFQAIKTHFFLENEIISELETFFTLDNKKIIEEHYKQNNFIRRLAFDTKLLRNSCYSQNSIIIKYKKGTIKEMSHLNNGNPKKVTSTIYRDDNKSKTEIINTMTAINAQFAPFYKMIDTIYSENENQLNNKKVYKVQD